jgi:hypothetical protein
MMMRMTTCNRRFSNQVAPSLFIAVALFGAPASVARAQEKQGVLVDSVTLRGPDTCEKDAQATFEIDVKVRLAFRVQVKLFEKDGLLDDELGSVELTCPSLEKSKDWSKTATITFRPKKFEIGKRLEIYASCENARSATRRLTLKGPEAGTTDEEILSALVTVAATGPAACVAGEGAEITVILSGTKKNAESIVYRVTVVDERVLSKDVIVASSEATTPEAPGGWRSTVTLKIDPRRFKAGETLNVVATATPTKIGPRPGRSGATSKSDAVRIECRERRKGKS